MRALELRNKRSYMPHEVGLETPLLFERLPLYLLVLPQDFAIPVSRIDTRLEWQTLKTQVSTICEDQVTVPVWMIEGQIPNGFFFGVLRPCIKKEPAEIKVLEGRPELHFYLEQEDLLLQGIRARDRDIPGAITVIARQLANEERRMDITPEFDAIPGLFPLPHNFEGISFVQIRNLI